MEPPPPPSREEVPAEKRPLDAVEDREVAAKKQRLADPSSPIDPKETFEVGNAYFCVAFRFAASRAFSDTATEPLLLSPSSRASGPLRARVAPNNLKCGDENLGRSRGLECDLASRARCPDQE